MLSTRKDFIHVFDNLISKLIQYCRDNSSKIRLNESGRKDNVINIANQIYSCFGVDLKTAITANLSQDPLPDDLLPTLTSLTTRLSSDVDEAKFKATIEAIKGTFNWTYMGRVPMLGRFTGGGEYKSGYWSDLRTKVIEALNPVDIEEAILNFRQDVIQRSNPTMAEASPAIIASQPDDIHEPSISSEPKPSLPVVAPFMSTSAAKTSSTLFGKYEKIKPAPAGAYLLLFTYMTKVEKRVKGFTNEEAFGELLSQLADSLPRPELQTITLNNVVFTIIRGDSKEECFATYDEIAEVMSAQAIHFGIKCNTPLASIDYLASQGATEQLYSSATAIEIWSDDSDKNKHSAVETRVIEYHKERQIFIDTSILRPTATF